MVNKKIRNIKNMAQEFDRSFDNTVVDTYAFDKVLRSKEFTDLLCIGFNQSCNLPVFKKEVSTFVIREVEKTYKKTQRRVINRAVYYEYIDTLFNRILQAS